MAKGAGKQTAFGKAFEFACVKALKSALSEAQSIVVEDSMQMETAKHLYERIGFEMQRSLDRGADAAVRIIKRLEPQLWFPNNNEPLFITIQSDAAGIQGDVRDVLCLRKQNGWEIGFSCKHNHHAVKHSRLSDTIDFGKSWFGIPCSKKYFETVKPIFQELRKLREDSTTAGSPALWNDISDKEKRYYKPILQAFMDELRQLNSNNDNIPRLLIQYLLGNNDFYKIITDDSSKTTRIEAININGTLNTVSGKNKPITRVPALKMPTKFFSIDFKPESATTIEVICDEGWQISMRIHNASSRVEPSLKFDVQLISFPVTVYSQTEPWSE